MANHPSLRIGDRAPDFSVADVGGGPDITLDDYRGRQPLFLGLYRGLHCPFCRRHLAQLDLVRRRLDTLGVATLAVVNTPVERARLYFRNSRTGVRLGADEPARIHRAYAVPQIEVVEPAARTAPWPYQTTIDEFLSHRVNPTGEMPEAVNPIESNDVLNKLDGFEMTPEDARVRERTGTLLVGHFLIDRAGRIGWRYIEGEATPAAIGRLPTPDQIVAAAGEVARAA
ncbi:MAG: redoxin domain-containing protein [Candidatus Rokubacteria bacterium]|nr:redoxin domain-containing protein [Candidatus Rokubacteria bacterium]